MGGKASTALRALALLGLLLGPPATGAQEVERRASSATAETGKVQADVQALLDATYRGDVDAILKYTHPSVIELQGGPDAARVALEPILQQLQQAGIHLVSISFPKPPEFLEGGGRRFAIIPTLSVLEANGQKLESLNFQFGVLDANATRWTYLEGSRINPVNVQKLFPGFPADYAFPEVHRKRL